MGISDELRDLAATPPEATAMSASLADQAVGFAMKARRVARMKIAAAVTAGAIATTGVAIGVVTSNDNSDLPASTPVVTITPSSAGPSQSSSASPSSSPSQSESPEQSSSPSDAPILVQPSQPELEPAGPGTDPNILEEILETLRSLPERIVEALRPDSPSEPDPLEADPSDTESTSPGPAAPSDPGSSSSETPQPSSPSITTTPSSSPSHSGSGTASPSGSSESSSPSEDVEAWCYIEKKSANGKVEPVEATCKKGEELRKELEENPPNPDSTAPTCELVTVPYGKETKDGKRTPVKCPDTTS